MPVKYILIPSLQTFSLVGNVKTGDDLAWFVVVTGKHFRCLPKLCQGLPRGLLTNHSVSAPDIFLIERISRGVKVSEQIQFAVLLSLVLTFILNNCQRFEGLT